MNSDFVLLLILGVAALAYYAGRSTCPAEPRIVYRWLPRNIEEETDPNAFKVLSAMTQEAGIISEGSR